MSSLFRSAPFIIPKTTRRANERRWWQEHNLDPLPVARRLWQKSRSVDRTPNAATTIESDEKKPISG